MMGDQKTMSEPSAGGMSYKPGRLLVVTNIFPNHVIPTSGIFNFYQIQAVANRCEVQVIAPIAYFPLIGRIPGLDRKSVSARFAKVKPFERQGDIPVYHPRYLSIPKIGRALDGVMFYRSLWHLVSAIRPSFDFDAIWATWAYPDGWASVRLARDLNKPVILKIHGSDVNAFIQDPARRDKVLEALQGADRVVAVSDALEKTLLSLGVPAQKIRTIYNGIDQGLFSPRSRREAREKLRLPQEGTVLLCIANLKPEKGVDKLLDAFMSIPSGQRANFYLYYLGVGFLEASLQDQIAKAGMEKQVQLLGVRPHAEVPWWIAASDLVCLPSLNEGRPNAVIEALSCGRPVVATRVGGVPELIRSEEQGVLVSPGDPGALREGILEALSRAWDERKIRSSVEPLGSWEESATRILSLFEEIISTQSKHECLH